MAEKFSTGLRDALASVDCLRRLMADFVIDIYAGSAPASADTTLSGYTKLVRITKAGAAVGATEKSVSKQAYLNITQMDAGAFFTPTVNSVAHAFTAGSGGDLATRVAEVAKQCEAYFPLLRVMAVAALTTTGGMVFQSLVPGLTFTLTIATTGAGTIGTECTHDALVDGTVIANSRCDALQLSAVASGIISKETGQTWQGTNLVTGTASFFRMVLPDDTAGTSTTAVRIQGACGTSGAELNLGSLNLTVDAITSIGDGDITFSES